MKKRKAVLFGRNVFIVPDGVYIKNTDDGIKVSHVDTKLINGYGHVKFSSADGTEVSYDFLGEFPVSAVTGQTVITNKTDNMYLYQYTGQHWKELYRVYIRLQPVAIPYGLSEGMSVSLKSDEKLFEDGYHTIISMGENFLVLSGSLKGEGRTDGLDIVKNLPLMDFAVEHNNRLWGCRYGKNKEGKFVNEIYASALGNPEEWYSFQGISTDSYAVNLGCTGEFTGAATLGNEVLFFKENFIIRVLGSTPSEFSVYTVPARGVESGQDSSLVNLEERLFYKSGDGIAVYDGTMPTVISEKSAFSGFSDSVACGINGKYKIAMTDPKGDRGIYAFDTLTSLWHREDDKFNTRFMFLKDGNLFHLGENEKDMVYTLFTDSFNGTAEKNMCLSLPFSDFYSVPEKEVEWLCETGKIADSVTSCNKKVRCIRFYLTLGEDSFVRAFIKPDAADEYQPVLFLDKKTQGIFTAAVPTVPCKYFSLLFSGKGEFTLHSIDSVVQLQGEVNNFE